MLCVSVLPKQHKGKKGTPLVNDCCLVSEAKSFDIRIDYNELDAIDSEEVKHNSLQEMNVADVRKVEVNGSFVTLTGYILFDDYRWLPNFKIWACKNEGGPYFGR